MSKPRFRPRADVAERRARVLALRTEQVPYTEIAAQLGISLSTAKMDRQRALEAAQAERNENAHLLVDAELAKLDAAERAVWTVLRARHVHVSGGKIVQDENGETLLDDGPVLSAVDRLVKIAARRAILTGLDVPARSRIEVVTAEMVEAEIARLEAADGDNPGTP